jgi:hypothetical protein
VHVTEGSIDAALGGDRVTPRGEELGNTGCVETGLGKTEGGAQTGSAGSDNNRVVLMVLDGGQLTLVSFSTGVSRGGVEAKTYDDGVLVADERRCLLCPERRICNDPRCTISTRSAAALVQTA